jgi:hypothetical protein
MTNFVDFTKITEIQIANTPIRALFWGKNKLWEKPTSIVATGGAINDVLIDGSYYRVHSFSANDNFQIVSGEGFIEIFLVAGGGAGGGGRAGGGGAGGIWSSEHPNASKFYMTPGTYPVVVGLGGIAAANTIGGNGGNTSIFGVLGIGGGGGGITSSATGRSGGSSGGAAGSTGNMTGSLDRVLLQGNFGGYGYSSAANNNWRSGGGGGGAGSNGTYAANSTGGNGGAGIQSNFIGTMNWYSPGGAGAAFGSGTVGVPGEGGGGEAAISTTPPTPTTSGAGGGGMGSTTAVAGNGALGIAHVRYKLYDYRKETLLSVVSLGNNAPVTSGINLFSNNDIFSSNSKFLTNMSNSNTGISLRVSTTTLVGGIDGLGITGSNVPTASNTFNGSLLCEELVNSSIYCKSGDNINFRFTNLVANAAYRIYATATRDNINGPRTTVFTDGTSSFEYDVSNKYLRQSSNVFYANSSGGILLTATNKENSTYCYVSALMIYRIEGLTSG